MKKLMMAMAAAMALGAGVAGAQSFKGQSGSYTLTGCYVTREGVRCDLNYLVDTDARLYFTRSLFQVVTPVGGNVAASQVAAGGSSFSGETDYINMYRGVPIKVSVLFDLPATTTSLRILTVEGQRADNVVVRSGAAPAPAPRPAAAVVPAPVNTGNYSAVLTECKPGTGGTLTCKAVLTPRR